MFCEESLGLELFQNGSVQEFYGLKALITLEQENTWVVEEKESNKNEQKTNWSGVVNFHCMQMSLVMSMQFIFEDD